MGRYYRRKRRRKSYYKSKVGGFVLLGIFSTFILSNIVNRITFLDKLPQMPLWVTILIAGVLLLLGTFFLLRHFYYKKIENNSVAIATLHKLNDDFVFCQIDDYILENSYDNEIYYDMISPRDYLTYQLVYCKKQVLDLIFQAEKNRSRLPVYLEKVNKIQNFDEYTCPKKPMFESLRKKVEHKIFNNTIHTPTTIPIIEVRLKLTNINGDFKTKKHECFSSDVIKKIVDGLNNRRGDFYLDSTIWDAICRVERGKVTNKLRFAVYKRDGYRCRKCGSKDNLEVDHIYPISKGGKTTFENLQTLCHNCNARKSNTIEAGVINPNAWKKPVELCPKCGKPLVVKNGKNGKFKGCSGYPNCRYTKNL